MTALAISTHSGCRFLKPSLQHWRRRSNCGIKGLGIPALRHCHRSWSLLILVVISQRLILVTPVNWASMLASLSIPLQHKPISLFKLFTPMFGHHLRLAIQGSNTMLFSWMISHTTFGHFQSVLSLRSCQLFDRFMLMCKPNSVYLLLCCKLTTTANMIHTSCEPSSPPMGSLSASLARIHPSRTARRNVCSAQLTTVYAYC